MAITYLRAGVDTERGDALVDRIGPLAKATRIAEVIGDVGGFAGLCRVPSDIDEPVLVSGTDGVGTKLKVAFATKKHDTIGIDLVAMCVNDVLTTGARPLFFLDYFGTGKLDVDVAHAVISGIAAGCKLAGCALLGGETAELPSMYADGEYDLAGFSVGVVARSKLVDGKRVAAGDVAIALPSSGLHSNGYALARHVLLTVARLDLNASRSELGDQTLGAAMLEPTRIYARAVAAVVNHVDVRAMCHITGGGLPGNVPRVLPDGLGLRVTGLPERPALMQLIASLGPVEDAELARTFNLGVGYVFVVAQQDCDAAHALLRAAGEAPFVLGHVEHCGDVAFEDRVMLP
jgi:phosphoribosylformylglycinamidine cyclo-ligase